MGETYFTLRGAAGYLREKFPGITPSYETIRQAILGGKLACGTLNAGSRIQYIIPESVLEAWFAKRGSHEAKRPKKVV